MSLGRGGPVHAVAQVRSDRPLARSPVPVDQAGGGRREPGVLGGDGHPDERTLRPFADPGGDRCGIAVDSGRIRDRGEEDGDASLELVELRSRGHAIDHRHRQAIGEHRAERRVDRFELELSEGLIERLDARAPEPAGQSGPLAGGPISDVAEFPEHVRPVGAERDGQAMLPEVLC